MPRFINAVVPFIFPVVIKIQELVKEFFVAFASNARLTLHIRQLGGENSHHIIEGAFKSVARSLSDATEIDEKKKDTVPSTKGVL